MDSEKQHKLHLTKDQRLPMCYTEVEKVLTSAKKCEANIKTVLHKSRLRGHILSKVTSLSVNVLKNGHIINGIIEEIQLLEKEPLLRKELAGILIYELITGRTLFGISKPIQTIRKYENEIQRSYNNLKKSEKFNNSLITLPRYVRVNTLVTTLSDVLEDLNYANMEQIFYDKTISDEEYLALLKDLKKGTFLIDKHFENLLVFHSKENLAAWSLYQKKHVCIQDKSSYIPSYVLAPVPGTSVIDACAAPGMKTLHLTALMENKGTIFAVERDQKRFEDLKKVLESHQADICETFYEDFKSVDPRDEKFSSVEYILLDPSCSGSGMVNRLDSVTDTERSKEEDRLLNLAGFQIVLLKHALLFPSVKRVVYSTCSTTETENEFVLQEVLSHFGHRFKLSCVLPDWPIRGSENYEFGHLCLRAFPEKNLTNGFFVAMLERIESPNGENYSQKEKSKKGKDKKLNKIVHSKKENLAVFKSNKNSVEICNIETNINDNCSLKEIHKNHRNSENQINEFNVDNEEIKFSKKYKSKHNENISENSSKKHKKMRADTLYSGHLKNSPNYFEQATQDAEDKQHVVVNEFPLPTLENKKKHKKKTKHEKNNDEPGLLENSLCNKKAQTDKQCDTEDTVENNEIEYHDVEGNQLSISALKNKKHKKKHKHKHNNEEVSLVENNTYNKNTLEDKQYDTEQAKYTVKVEQHEDDENQQYLSTLENKKKRKKKNKHNDNDELSILENNSFGRKMSDTELAIKAVKFEGYDIEENKLSLSTSKNKKKDKHPDNNEIIPLENNTYNKRSSGTEQATEAIKVETHDIDGNECYFSISEKKKKHKHKHRDSDEFILVENNTSNKKSSNTEQVIEAVEVQQHDVDENSFSKNFLQNKKKHKRNHNDSHDAKLMTESDQHIYENELSHSAVETKKKHKKKHKHKHNDNDE